MGLPYSIAGKITAETLRKDIEEIIPSLLPLYLQAIAQYKKQPQNFTRGHPFRLMLTGSVARIIAMRHLLGEQGKRIAAKHRVPSDMDLMLVRSQAPKTSPQSFNVATEYYFRSICNALAQIVLDAQWTTKVTPEWMQTECVASPKSADISLLFEEMTALQKSSGHVFIDIEKLEFCFADEASYQKFTQFEIGISQIEQTCSANFDLSAIKKDEQQLLEWNKNSEIEWHDFTREQRRIAFEKSTVYQHRSSLAHLIYTAASLVTCDYKFDTKVEEVIKSFIAANKEIAIAIYNEFLEKKHKKLEKSGTSTPLTLITNLSALLFPTLTVEMPTIIMPSSLAEYSPTSSHSEGSSVTLGASTPDLSGSTDSSVGHNDLVESTFSLSEEKGINPTQPGDRITNITNITNTQSNQPTYLQVANSNSKALTIPSNKWATPNTHSNNNTDVKHPNSSIKNKHRLHVKTKASPQNVAAMSHDFIALPTKDTGPVPVIETTVANSTKLNEAPIPAITEPQNPKVIPVVVPDYVRPTKKMKAKTKQVAADAKIGLDEPAVAVENNNSKITVIQETVVSQRTNESTPALMNNTIAASSDHFAVKKQRKKLTHSVVSVVVNESAENASDSVMAQVATVPADVRVAPTLEPATIVPPGPTPETINYNFILRNLQYFCMATPFLGYGLNQYIGINPYQTGLSVLFLGAYSLSVDLMYRWHAVDEKNEAIKKFEQEKAKLIASPTWDVMLFTAVIRALREIPQAQLDWLTGDPKLVFLRKIIKIYENLDKYSGLTECVDNGRYILDIVRAANQDDLEIAAKGPYLFLAEMAPYDPNASELEQKRARINNYILGSDEKIPKYEKRYAEGILEKFKILRADVCYAIAYNQIKVFDAVRSAQTLQYASQHNKKIALEEVFSLDLKYN